MWASGVNTGNWLPKTVTYTIKVTSKLPIANALQCPCVFKSHLFICYMSYFNMRELNLFSNE